MMKIIILLIFISDFLFAGDIEGVVYRKSAIIEVPKINRYSLRNSASKESEKKQNNSLAIFI